MHVLKALEFKLDLCVALIVFLAENHLTDLRCSVLFLRCEFTLHLAELVGDVAREILLSRLGLLENVERICGLGDPVVDFAHVLLRQVQVRFKAFHALAEVAVVVLNDALVFFELLLVFLNLRVGDSDFVLEFLQGLL